MLLYWSGINEMIQIRVIMTDRTAPESTYPRLTHGRAQKRDRALENYVCATKDSQAQKSPNHLQYSFNLLV